MNTTTTKDITMITDTITPSVTTVGTPTEVLVNTLLTIEQTDTLLRILDAVRNEWSRDDAQFAHNLHIAIERAVQA